MNYTPLHLPPLCLTQIYTVQKHQISYLYLYPFRIIFLTDDITVFYMLEPFVQIKYVIMCTLFCLFKKLEISAVIEITEE